MYLSACVCLRECVIVRMYVHMYIHALCTFECMFVYACACACVRAHNNCVCACVRAEYVDDSDNLLIKYVTSHKY